MPTYTGKLKLAQQDSGACNWKWSEDRNKDITDAVNSQLMQGNFTVSGGVLSGASGLNINIDETVVVVDGTEYTTIAATLSLTGAVVDVEEQNFIWIDSTGTLQNTTVPPTGSFAIIGVVDTDVTAVIRQSDLRQVEIVTERSPVEDIIINPRLTINQRTFDGNWAALVDTDFGWDYWRKSGNNMIQPVLEGNYIPLANYYLFGTGVTASIMTAPASGVWEITVPQTATEIHLVDGERELPVRRRKSQEELDLCFPLCWRQTGVLSVAWAAYATGAFGAVQVSFPTRMVATPVATTFGAPTYLVSSQNASVSRLAQDGFRLQGSSTAVHVAAQFEMAGDASNYFLFEVNI